MNNCKPKNNIINFKLGLRLKIISIIALFIIVMAGSLIIFFSYQQKELLVADTEKWGISLVLNLAYDSEYGVLVKDKLILDHLLESLLQEKDVICVRIFDLPGERIADFIQKGKCDQKCFPRFTMDDKNWLRQKDYVSRINSERLQIAVPVKTYQEPQTTAGFIWEEEANHKPAKSQIIGYIKLEISLQERLEALNHTRNLSILIISLISIVFGFILSEFLESALLGPIMIFVHGAKVIAQGDYEQKITIKSNDEIGQLAEVFNDMTREVNKSHREIVHKVEELEMANKELKDTQEQLVQAGKLSALGQLAAGISHELKNPLGGILGYAQFIMEKAEKKGVDNLTQNDMKAIVSYVRNILDAATRCASIIKSLLKFSRKSSMETEQQEILDIQEVLEETFVFTRHQLEINQIELAKNFTPDLPPVIGVKQQLQQVFVNMIVNAQQAMKAGGRLTIVTFTECAQGDHLTSWLIVRFIDTGCGIDPQNINKIFDPFFTTKPVGEGTGLGLSVSYGIIKDHLGEILVQSETGKGTTFSVWLPVAGEQKIAALEAADGGG